MQPWNIKIESPSRTKGWHVYYPFKKIWILYPQGSSGITQLTWSSLCHLALCVLLWKLRLGELVQGNADNLANDIALSKKSFVSDSEVSCLLLASKKLWQAEFSLIVE